MLYLGAYGPLERERWGGGGGESDRQTEERWGGGGSDSQKEGVDRQETESGTQRNKERNRQTYDRESVY